MPCAGGKGPCESHGARQTVARRYYHLHQLAFSLQRIIAILFKLKYSHEANVIQAETDTKGLTLAGVFVFYGTFIKYENLSTHKGLKNFS